MRMRSVFAAVSLCLIASACASSEDWPVYLKNNARNGKAQKKLSYPLKTSWTYESALLPSPAWPRALYEVDRITFDYASQPVISGGILYFGSTTDDTLRAISLSSGEIRWRFTAEGPIRFAPAIDNGMAYVVSDDGYLYCLNANSGKLRWRFRGGPRGDRIVGSRRIISRWPMRSGVLVQDGTAYVIAGMWPAEGIFVYALDAKTGKVRWCNDTSGAKFVKQPHYSEALSGVTPQGYLLAGSGVLLVPCGRGMPAGFDMKTGELIFHYPSDEQRGQYSGGSWIMIEGENYYLEGRGRQKMGCVLKYALANGTGGKKIGRKVEMFRSSVCVAADTIVDPKAGWQYPFGRVFETIRAGSDILVGGDGKVEAIDGKTGKKIWAAPIKGRAYGLAVSKGSLVVSTDTGRVYCFAKTGNAKIVKDYQNAAAAPLSGNAKAAVSVAKKYGINRGFAIVIGEQDARLAQALAGSTEVNVIGFLSDEDVAAGERKRLLQSTPYYGSRVSLHITGKSRALPFSAYSANMIVVSGSSHGFSGKDILRVLRPCGGVLCIFGKGTSAFKGVKSIAAKTASVAGAKVIVRDALKGAFDFNSKVAADELVKWPLSLGWYGGPGPAKIGSKQQVPLAAYGRVFLRGQEFITAVDAYNGTELWSHKIGHFFGRDLRPIPRSDEIACYANSTMYANDRDFYLHFKEAAKKEKNPRTGMSVSVCFDAATGVVKKYYGLKKPAGSYDLKKSPGFDIASGGTSSGRITVSQDASGLKLKLVTQDPTVVSPVRLVNKYRVYEHWTDGDYWDLYFDFRGETERFGLYGPETFHLIVAPTEKRICRRGKGEVHPEFQAKGGIAGKGSAVEVTLSWDALEKILGRKPASFGFGAALHSFDRKKKEVGKTGYFAADRYALALNNGWATIIIGAGAKGVSIPRSLVEDLSAIPDAVLSGRYAPIRSRRSGGKGRGAYKTHLDPLTGVKKPMILNRSHGCGGVSSSAVMDFQRSSTLGYYDFEDASGMRNWGGIKPTCQISTIPALGMVYVNTSVQCACSYSYFGSMGLVPASVRSNEDWACFPYMSIAGEEIKHLFLNLGAPGDRRDTNGNLWLSFPRTGHKPHRWKIPYTYQVPVETKGASELKAFRVNADRIKIDKSNHPWIHASWVCGVEELTVMLTSGKKSGKSRSFTVKLHFCELDDVKSGDRVFSVGIQDKTVIDRLDVIKEAGGRYTALIKEYKKVKASDRLSIRLVSKKKNDATSDTILSGIEVIAE